MSTLKETNTRHKKEDEIFKQKCINLRNALKDITIADQGVFENEIERDFYLYDLYAWLCTVGK